MLTLTALFRPPSKRATALPDNELKQIAERLDALLRLVEQAGPQAPAVPDFQAADAFVWHPAGKRLQPVAKVNRVEIGLLRGVDRLRDILVENTERFAGGLPANNVLLW